MIEGRYRLEGDDFSSPWIYNMITDKGYDFWTKGDATLGGNYVKGIKVGSDPSLIPNLNPATSIEALQTPPDSVNTYLINSYRTSLKKSQTSAVITHEFSSDINVERFKVLSEIGLSLDNVDETLMSYSIFKSTEGLDIIPVMIKDVYPYSTKIIYELNIRIPFIVKEYSTILLDNDVETPFKVSLKLLDTLAASSNTEITLKRPFSFSASILGEEGLGYPTIEASEVRLSTYNKVTKEAVYNIVFNYNGSLVRSPEKYKTITLISTIGDYHIELLDPLDDVNKGFPDTLARDLVIPFKVSL